RGGPRGGRRGRGGGGGGGGRGGGGGWGGRGGGGGGPPGGPAVHDGLHLAGVQVERLVGGALRRVHVVLVQDDRDPDLRRGDHLDVHARLGERGEEGRAHARVRPHPGPDERHL